MKNNEKQRHPASKGLLLRGLFMAVAMAGSATAVYVMTAPSAMAAAQSGAPDNPSWFARMHGHSHAGMRAHFDGVLAQAKVTQPQKQAIDRIVHEAMLAEHADMARYHAAAGELKQLLVASRIDETAVERLRGEQDRVAADASRTLTEAAVQVARLLTPAQRQAIGGEVDRMMADVPGHHHGG